MAAKRVAVKLSTEGVSRTLFRRRRRHEVGAKAEILTDSTWRVEPDVRKARKIAKENPAQIRWRVTDYQDGQRRRFFFPTEAQALDKVQVASIRRENLGARVANLDGRLIEDAVEAHKMLEPFGVSLLTAVRDYVSRARATEKSRPVADVVKEFILEREAKGMSKFYLSDLKIRLGRFSENFGDHIASEIESRDVDSWATELNVAAVTVGNYLRCVSALFSFAVRRGYSSINPAAAVEKPKVVKDAPEIFTPAQVDALLRSSPIESVPYFAIGVFAGLRPEEMKRLDWSQIDLEGRVIEVTGKQAKTNKRRLVDISPILLVWLRLHRRDSGAVTPSGIRRLRESAMKAAEIRSWPVDVLRHSFVSYSVARDQNVAKTALQAGHSVETLNQHYRNLVKPSDAVKFWRITPKPSKKECEQTKGIKKRG